MPARAKTAAKPAAAKPAAANGDHHFTAFDEGVDPGGYPVGLLMWGQAGIYNSPDDRMVITALSDSVTGIVRPAQVTPGAGLTLNVAAGWLGIASAGDGTTAVVGSRQSHTLGAGQGVQAGSAVGGPRNDILWCDTYPDDAYWRLSVIRESESYNRPGLPLALITVPQGANLASGFAISRLVPTFGMHAESLMLSTSTGGNAEVISPRFAIAPWMIRPRSHFRLRCFGWGRWGPSIRHVMFRTGLLDSPQMWLNFAGAGFPVGGQFSWHAEVEVQCRMNRQFFSTMVKGEVRPQAGAGGSRAQNSVSAVQVTAYSQWDPAAWQNLLLQARFDAAAAGQLIECTSATFETIQPYDA